MNSTAVNCLERVAKAWCCGILVSLALCSSTQEAAAATPGITADRITLGQSAKISGSSGTIAGKQYRDGLLLAFDAAAKAGGIHGRTIELVSLDDQNDAAKAAANTRTLIDDRGVFALAGYTFSNTVRAALPLLRATQTPLVGAYTGMPELYDGSQPLVFALRASFADELDTIIRHIATVGYDEVAMVHYTNPLGQEFRRDVEERLGRIGLSLVATGAMQISAPDYAAAAQGAMHPLVQKCPKLVILGVSGRDAAAIVQGLSRSACKGTRFIGRNIVDVGVLQQMLGNSARGVIITQVVPNPARGIHPLTTEYRALLRKRDAAAKPDFAEFEGYIAGRCIVEALSKAGRDLDRPRFIRALESVVLDGPDRFRIQFGAGKRIGTRYSNIVMVSDKDRIVD